MAVDSTDGFVEDVRSAEDEDTIVVDPHTLIDLSDYRPGDFEGLAHGITITAGTGMKDRPAATIRYDPGERVDGALFKTWGDVEFRGFSVYGPEPRVIDLDRDYELCFLWGLGDSMEVGGCYFEGFPFAALASGAKNSETNLTFANSTVRNCRMRGYGYAVEQYNGFAKYWNLDINHCRHGIAGFGWPTCSYEVARCRFGPHFVSHQLDMHRASESAGEASLEEKDTDPQDAGGDMYVHHNTFEMTHDYNERPQEAIAIRGVPTGKAIIEKNRFRHPEPEGPGEHGSAVRQQGVDEWTNVVVADDNEYGVGFTIPQHRGAPGRDQEEPAPPDLSGRTFSAEITFE